jgi:hypothetical protein
VTIPAGQASVTFTVRTTADTSQVAATISATLGATTDTAGLTITAT